MAEPAVRVAVPEDGPALAQLEASAFPTDRWSDALVAEGVAGAVPTVTWLVAERDEVLLGYAVVSVVDVDAELQRIAVVAHERRTGAGTALLTAARAHAEAEGAARLLLEVREDNRPALAFYARHGFAELGRRPRYYRDGTTALVLSTPVTMEP